MVTYCTAAQVKAMLGNLHGPNSTAEIEQFIVQAEGVVNSILKIGTNGSSLTFSASKSPHNVINLATCSLAAAITCANALPSNNTMEEVVLKMESALRWYKEAISIMQQEDIGDFVVEQ